MPKTENSQFHSDQIVVAPTAENKDISRRPVSIRSRKLSGSIAIPQFTMRRARSSSSKRM